MAQYKLGADRFGIVLVLGPFPDVGVLANQLAEQVPFLTLQIELGVMSEVFLRIHDLHAVGLGDHVDADLAKVGKRTLGRVGAAEARPARHARAQQGHH